MTVCSHTGISVPECSCRACVQAQIERHMPSLLGTAPLDQPTLEIDTNADADYGVLAKVLAAAKKYVLPASSSILVIASATSRWVIGASPWCA